MDSFYFCFSNLQIELIIKWEIKNIKMGTKTYKIFEQVKKMKINLYK